MDPSTPPKNIIIIGGSMAGLFTGTVLLNHPSLPTTKITILERTPSHLLSSQGAGISVGPVIPHVVGALKALGSSGYPLIDFFTKYNKTKTLFYETGTGFQGLKRNRELKERQKVEDALGRDGVDSMDCWLPLKNDCRFGLCHLQYGRSFDERRPG